METETKKQIMWAEHAARCEPPQRHYGPWNPWKDARPMKETPRLVWCQTRRGNHTETRCDLNWADK